MSTSSADETFTADLSSMEAEFVTTHLVIRAALTSPDLRLSDHLNSPTATVEILPSLVRRTLPGAEIRVAGMRTVITKAHLLFVLPGREIQAQGVPEDQPWRQTVTYRCVTGIGPYTVIGQLHAIAGRNPRLVLRSLEHRQFVPLTDAQVILPDSSSRQSATVIVNRSHLELLATDIPGW